MKTTFDLPDDLFVAAKKRAAEERVSLRDLVARGLRTQLAGRSSRAKRSKSVIKWVTVEGGLPDGIDVADRDAMHDQLRRRQ
jgi:hypothetical protein